jgi:hypothetical protein
MAFRLGDRKAQRGLVEEQGSAERHASFGKIARNAKVQRVGWVEPFAKPINFANCDGWVSLRSTHPTSFGTP